MSQKKKVPVDREIEINQLTKKVNKYRLQVAETEQKMEEMSKKAASRMQKLEHNWRAADTEVCKLDSLIDAIRAILVNHSLAKDEQLKTVINMIDGK
ncbi:hypothetical protein DPMN_016999 [Dreissena polymorpha]|nr:hypothetical protein DPMN_016999 [Dreissena polymorpha]